MTCVTYVMHDHTVLTAFKINNSVIAAKGVYSGLGIYFVQYPQIKEI